jgi:transcriptional regulator with XRE-family HTH domain
MNREDFIKLLRATLRSKEPLLYDEEVQPSMSEKVEIPPGSLKRGRDKYAYKMFGRLHPEPVNQIEEGLTFGQWLRRVRKKALLTPEGLAEVVDKEPAFIEHLETGETSLLSLSASNAADLAILLRLHINGMAQLLFNSEAAREGMDEAKIPLPAGTKAGVADHSNDPFEWLGALYEELQRRQATHLLP